MPSNDDVTVTLTRTEALALARVADLGIRAAETFALIQKTATAAQALAKLNAAAAKRK